MAASQVKRRRRRRLDKTPLSGNLLLDERMKEEVGIISEDLCLSLFPASDVHDKLAIRHLAITPWVPSSQASLQNSTWTILPVRSLGPQETPNKTAHSSIRLSAGALALQSFFKTLQVISPGKALLRKDVPIEVRIVPVAPIVLDAVYVTLDVAGLLKSHESQVKFGGGFSTNAKHEPLKHKALNGVSGHRRSNSSIDHRALESEWRQAVRKALSSTGIVHAGDQIPLPLPAHPITHIGPPPAKITTCEPVSQGLIVANTRIVIIRQSEKSRGPKHARQISAVATGIPEEDEDTSNEQFYSAAEDRPGSIHSNTDGEETSLTDFSDAQSIVTDGEDLTDDEEALISLSAPTLPPQTSGILSAYNAATPRPGLYTNNIGTPGSLHSASTVKGLGNGKVFKAHGLLQRVPNDQLYPKPSPGDDEEARIYVETSALVKIGCFSGDWVRIEAAPEPNAHGISLIPWQSSFDEPKGDHQEWRPVKIFGLPESKKPIRFSSHKGGARRTLSFHYDHSSPPATAYLPPVLITNLSSTSHIKITPLVAPGQGTGRLANAAVKGRITSSSMPPLASEVKILKILSPLSHDIQLQPALYAALKDYFEGKRRIMKAGDLVAITFDEVLGRSVFRTGADAISEELLSGAKHAGAAKESKTQSANSVAWFKVTSVVCDAPGDDDIDSLWGGAGYIDVTSTSGSTKLIQNGNDSARLPPIIGSAWQYYTGVKGLPDAGGMRLPGTISLPDSYTSPLRRRIRGLISASTSPQAIHMGLPPLAILLTSTQRQVGKSHTAERACEDLGLHCCIIDAYDATTNSAAGTSETEEYFKARAQRALSCGAQNTVLLVKHIDALSGDRMLPTFKDTLAESRVIIATTTDPEKIPESLRSLFTNELEFGAPDEGEREGILRDIVEDLGLKLSPTVELSSIALKTAALVAGDLVDVVNRAVVAKHARLEKIADINSSPWSNAIVTVQDLEVAGGSSTLSLTKADFESAVDAARKNFADAIGAPKIPNVSWDDVGGLAHIKEAVMETIQLPLARPELFAKGMKKRSGILFYGPPGTGKTLLAKAIATEFSLNFFSVKGPELLNMYIGESEANVRRVFQRARDARPCVVFFDELDSVAPKRGNQGDSGGVMDRIVSQLLAELDGMSNGDEGAGGVFVIGATNRPDLLDQALLRPGRFDKMLYLGISDTHEKQQKIMEALSRKFTLDPSCSLQRVSQTLPFTYTGADLYALCSDAMLKAITRAAKLVDDKVAARNASLRPGQNPLTIAQFFDHYATDDDTSVTVREEDFRVALKELVPSVSAEEFAHYERVRQAFEGKDSAKSQPTTDTKAKAAPLKLAAPPASRTQPSNNNVRSPSYASTANKTTIPIGRKPVQSGSNGSAQSQRPAAAPRNGSSFYFDQQDGSAEDLDDYTVRTDHLVRSPSRSTTTSTINTVVNGSVNGGDHGDDMAFLKQFGQPQARENIRNSIGSLKESKAKSKGRRVSQTSAFGSPTNGDDDMYR